MIKKLKDKLFNNRIWFFSYLIFIVLLVSLPLNTSGELNDINIIQIRGDYFFHALLFLPWVFFKPAINLRFFWFSFAGLLIAAGSEALQYLLPYRAWNINDLIANVSGVVIGIALYSILIGTKQKNS
jgi:glycopeptide antibiotics resistance protein